MPRWRRGARGSLASWGTRSHCACVRSIACHMQTHWPTHATLASWCNPWIFPHKHQHHSGKTLSHKPRTTPYNLAVLSETIHLVMDVPIPIDRPCVRNLNTQGDVGSFRVQHKHALAMLLFCAHVKSMSTNSCVLVSSGVPVHTS